MLGDLKLILILILNIIVCTNAYIPNILHGRLKHGFVPPPKIRSGVKLPEDRWFTQTLNHFSSVSDSRTWQQRYFVNDSFHTPDGPVFLMIGGEGTASPIWMVEGQWIKYAAKYNALCVQLEHRFYGKSHPTEDTSVESLQYLSSEQALADLASFTTYIGTIHNVSHSKWIAFGGSYPGSLSAWFRLKYPHLVDGSVSSSAPLRAVIDFSAYLGVVRDALDTTGPQCTANIQNATAAIEHLLQSEDGRQKVKMMFNLCGDIDISSQDDIANLYSTLAGNFEGVVQYNKDNRHFEGAVGADITVDTLCNIMSAPQTTPLQNYAIVNALMMKTYSQKCVDFSYKGMIQGLRDTDWSSEAAEGGRQWIYQTCTEFGYYQSSDLKDQPFGHSFPVHASLRKIADSKEQQSKQASTIRDRDQVAKSPGTEGGQLHGDAREVMCLVEIISPKSIYEGHSKVENHGDATESKKLGFSVQQCADIFGPNFNLSLLQNAVKWTNTNYGALALKVTRVVFINGSIDPWHALGLTSDTVGKENHVIYINGTAHCANMYPDATSDPPQLREARERVSDLIGQWIQGKSAEKAATIV